MSMTTVLTMRYEGAPSCVDCQRIGMPECVHVGFNPEAWESLVARRVHAPGLDAAYDHILDSYEIGPNRKVVTLTVVTERPQFHDLARHLSLRTAVAGKAAVQAVHHETGAVLEEGHYDRFLQAGEQVAIDRDLYHVASVEHPNRDPVTGTCADVDLQIARLLPVPTDTVRPVDTPAVSP